jgi:hypothetical protein
VNFAVYFFVDMGAEVTVCHALTLENLFFSLCLGRSGCDSGGKVYVFYFRNSIRNIHLPLMIFIKMHSHESQFHNNCLICSIKSIIYVQLTPFGLRVQNTI